MNRTLIRFLEAFIAVFVVSFAADPIFTSGTFNFGSDGLHALGVAAISAAIVAIRRVVATQS